RRRGFIMLVGGSAFVWSLVTQAQQPTMPAVWFLDPRSPDAMADRLRAFRLGLKELGYEANSFLSAAFSLRSCSSSAFKIFVGHGSPAFAAIANGGCSFRCGIATRVAPIVQKEATARKANRRLPVSSRP